MSAVCLIIPCYNEEKRLKKSDFEDFLNRHPDYDLLFVNDGSLDATDQVLERFTINHPNALKYALNKNAGKAQAVRSGFLEAIKMRKYRYIGYLDADLATPFHEILRLEQVLKDHPEFKIALGSRWKRLGAQIKRNWFRHYLGRFFATVVSYLFKMDVYDTQCGAKLMVNDDLDPIFQEIFKSQWFFDIEILIRMQQNNPEINIEQWAVEVPLNYWQEIGGSRIKLLDFLSVPFQLLKIKYHYKN